MAQGGCICIVFRTSYAESDRSEYRRRRHTFGETHGIFGEFSPAIKGLIPKTEFDGR